MQFAICIENNKPQNKSNEQMTIIMEKVDCVVYLCSFNRFSTIVALNTHILLE